MIDKTLQTLAMSFNYLVTEEGFQTVKAEVPGSFGNRSIEFRSPFSRIMVGVDRGSVYVLVTPDMSGQDCWIDLGTLISYLTQSETDDIYETHGINFQPEIPFDERVATQAEGLAGVLKDHLEETRSLFASRQAEEICTDLFTYGRARDERRAGL